MGDIEVIERFANGQYGYSSYFVLVSSNPVSQFDEFLPLLIKPDIHSWEIIVPNDERETLLNHGEPHDHIFITRIEGFGEHFADQLWSKENYGNVAMSAGKEYLLLNYENFERFQGYMYCGGGAYVGQSNKAPECFPINNLKIVNLGFVINELAYES